MPLQSSQALAGSCCHNGTFELDSEQDLAREQYWYAHLMMNMEEQKRSLWKKEQVRNVGKNSKAQGFGSEKGIGKEWMGGCSH